MDLKQRRKIISLGKYITASAVLGKFISIPTNIFIAKILGPESYGVLAIIDTIMIYMSYTNLGMLMNLERQVPIEKAKSLKNEIEITYSTSFSNYFFTTIFSVALILTSFLFGFTFKTDGSIGILIIISFTLLSRNLNSAVSTYIKAEGEFDVFGKNTFLLTFLRPTLTLFFAYFYGLYGLLFAMILLNVISSIYIYNLSPSIRFFQIKWNKKKTQKLFGTGIRLFIGNKLESFLFTTGVLIISNFGTIEEVGIYSFAYMLISVRQFPFSKAISIVVNREMNLKAGEKGEKNYKEFYSFFQKNLAIYLLLVVLVMGTILLVFNVIVESFLLKYINSIPLMYIFFGLTVIHSSRIYSDYYFNATNQMVVKIKHTSIAIIISLILGTLSMKLNWGGIGVATSITLSIVITALPQIYKAFVQVSSSKQESYFILSKLILITILLQVLVFFLSHFYLENYIELNQTNISILLNSLLRIALYIFSCFLLFELFFQQFRIFNTTLNFAKSILFKNNESD